MPSRPQGRLLADLAPLSAVEEALLNASRLGISLELSDERPNEASPTNIVRAALLRFLLLGGDDDTPVHERGIFLSGAWIEGTFDLSHVQTVRPLVLYKCVLGAFEAVRAQLKSLNLTGCHLREGLRGDGMRCDDDVFLRNGFIASRPLRLNGASIRGDFDCSGARIDGVGECAILGDGTEIGRALSLGSGFSATGEVRFVGATISRGLEAHGGRFKNPGGDALNVTRAVITGGVCLRDTFYATGAVRLDGARIEGNCTLTAGSFDQGTQQDSENEPVALSLRGAQISGALVLKGVTRIDGRFDLSELRAGRLNDEAESWQAANGEYVLDGFRYDRLSDGAPIDAMMRTKWLEGQVSEHVGTSFRSQPWEQLITVLRAAGHPEQARQIAIAKQDHLRSAGKIVAGGGWLHALYGVLAGYGYRPRRLIVSMLAVWLTCGVAYDHNRTWLCFPNSKPPPACEISKLSEFNAWVYSADVLLPIIDFEHAKQWQIIPEGRGRLLRVLYWLEIFVGWFTSVLLVGVVSSLIKKD